jgi:hypothetical protein
MHGLLQVRACHKELLSIVNNVCFMDLPQQQAEQQGQQRPLGNRGHCSKLIKVMMHHALQFCFLQQRWGSRVELSMDEQQVGVPPQCDGVLTVASAGAAFAVAMAIKHSQSRMCHQCNVA